MDPTLWMGNQASFSTLQAFEKKYQFDDKAKLAYLDDSDDEVERLDPDFLVKHSRIGLYLMEKYGDVAVIKVHGSLTPQFSRWHTWFPGEVTSYAALKDALMIAAESDNVKEVLLDFATGGGAVSGLDTVTQVIDRVKAIKPVNGHTDRSAFSAGYWIMAGCTRTSASRMAETGSIGTLAIIGHMADPANHYDMSFTVFREGEFKALGNPYEKLTEAAKAYIQNNLKQANAFFLEHVSTKRNLRLEDKDKWAEGKTFYAREAVQLGLIDRIANLDDLIGSGAAANKPGDNRSYAMKISQEKRAQIAAGADPKEVLTAEEFVQYEAEIKAAADASAKEEQDAKDAAAAEQAKKDAANPATGDPVDEPEPEANANANVSVSLSAELKTALRDVGKLEAKMEALTEENAKLKDKYEAAQAESASLLVLAKAAVSNLQVGTQSPKEEKATATEVLAQYNDLQAKLAKMFTVGQNSRETPVSEPGKTAVKTHGYRQPVTP